MKTYAVLPLVALSTIIISSSMLFVTVHCQEDGADVTTLSNEEESATTENEIPVFHSTTISTTLRPQHKESLMAESMKKKRLLKFLRHFRLDFSKFDTTCMKREGRGIQAPPVPNARITKYTRRRNRTRPRNHYAMAMYECVEGYEFPPESADRMFCSRNKWVGPTPVCLQRGSIDESECFKCEQICSVDEHGDTNVTCSCYSGYEMINGTCQDYDECSVNNGGCSGICFNKPGSFQCFCPSGFQVGPDGKNCIDRNECLLRNGHGPCQDSCMNSPGSYSCSCEGIAGTRLAADKHSCEDINECNEDNNFGCSHMCLNTFGNAFCACPSGLILSPTDYKTCLSEQTETPPENLELQNIVDCPPGSTPDVDNSRICVEHEDCTVDNGGCDHLCVPSGTFRFCSCRSGYELLNETACVDVNECEQENGGCDQQCLNIPGGHLCDCNDNYQLSDDKKTCTGKSCDELPDLPNMSGWECEHNDLRIQPSESHKPVIGAKCKPRCLAGFTLHTLGEEGYDAFVKESDSVITCRENGKWSSEELLTNPMQCVSSSCKKLPEPKHGSLFPDTCLSDNVPLNSQCLVLCSPGFYPKNGRMRTCSKGFRWFPEDNPLCIRLPPTPRPYIHCPSDVEVDLKPGQSSSYVKIPQPQANMDWYRYVEADPPWAKNLEWDVPAGVTQVVFTARSPISNDTATCHFKIHVVDKEAPRVQGCPTSFEIRLSPGETAREVWWSEPKFTDNVKLHYVQQSHSPGHLMSRGAHHISFIAGDAEGNKARCSFTITVHGSEDYEMSDYSFYSGSNSYRHMVICPNLKTGRWTLHYAYYLPPGCRYHSQGLFSKLFKQNTYRNLIPRLRRRTSSH